MIASRALPSGIKWCWAELGLALFLLGIGGVVMVDSLRVGIGWAADGPRAGYFPFYVGLVLSLVSACIAVRQLLAWAIAHQAQPYMVQAQQLRDLAAVLVPTTLYVASIWVLGIYLPSALLIAYFMWRQGGYRWFVIGLMSIGFSLCCFVVFERWFLAPLPKGPLEHWMGF